MIKKPKYSKKLKEVEFERLVEEFEVHKLCPICKTVCYSGDKHCYECGRCVKGFHVHDDRIGTCITRDNCIYFGFLTFFTLVYYLLICIMLLLNRNEKLTKDDNNSDSNYVVMGFNSNINHLTRYF